MTITSQYMALLARIMQNKGMQETSQGKEKYNNLYYMVRSDLNVRLQKSMYPFTSDIVQKTENMMEAMESLYICPEIVGKKCVLVSSYITTNIFGVCKSLFLNQDFISVFKRIYTQIPFVVVDTEEADSIEVVNYANVRVSLSDREFKFLVIESGKRKIAINKVIQFVIVKTKLCEEQLCVVVDNIYAEAEKKFRRAVSQCIAYVDEGGVRNIGRRHLNHCSALMMSNDVYDNAMNSPVVKKYRSILTSEINEYVKNEVKPVLYGFWEEYTSIETQITDYYERQLFQVKSTLQEVVGDIVRLGDSKDETLQSIRLREETRENKLKSESENISETLKGVEKLITEICAELGEKVIGDKTISRDTTDDIFESLFRCKKFGSGLGKKLLSRLYSYEYDNYDLVTAYVQALSETRTEYLPIEVDKSEWEKAKMLISISDPDKIPVRNLRTYIDTLGERCCTGKELYAKSLVCPESSKVEALQESFEKGYVSAGLRLLDMYKQGDKSVNLMSLVNALVPEACMIAADQKLSGDHERKRYVNLADSGFTYYKIAATTQYSPAIGKIVDIVFESRFSSGFQIPAYEMNDFRHAEMIRYGHIVCQLCQFLIGKMYRTEHYSEVLGIVLFSINENLSGAMSLLTNVDSALACYCKGVMYEFGNGVAADLDQAIKNYELSLRKKFQKKRKRDWLPVMRKSCDTDRRIWRLPVINQTRTIVQPPPIRVPIMLMTGASPLRRKYGWLMVPIVW